MPKNDTEIKQGKQAESPGKKARKKNMKMFGVPVPVKTKGRLDFIQKDSRGKDVPPISRAFDKRHANQKPRKTKKKP